MNLTFISFKLALNFESDDGEGSNFSFQLNKKRVGDNESFQFHFTDEADKRASFSVVRNTSNNEISFNSAGTSSNEEERIKQGLKCFRKMFHDEIMEMFPINLEDMETEDENVERVPNHLDYLDLASESTLLDTIENPFIEVATFSNVSDEILNDGVGFNEADKRNETSDTCHHHFISFDQLLSGVLKLTIAENMIGVIYEIIGVFDELTNADY